MEVAIAAVALILSIGTNGYYQLKALHRIEEQLDKLVNHEKHHSFYFPAEKRDEKADEEED